MNSVLICRNKMIRQNRPIIPSDKLYSVFENNGVFQICFRSRGCSNYLSGSCIMCDYGVGTNIREEELELAFDKAISESKKDIKILLLNTYGSILDTNEISDGCFNVLIEKLKTSNIKVIIFETHYNTITEEKLKLIKEELKDKIIYFELGFETSNEEIRENNLLKKIDNEEFKETIKMIHLFKMGVIVNLLVGIPFLTEQEQLEDALNSIEWCINNDVDEINLFPINIKPYTLLKELYDLKEYDVISHWLLVEVLNRVPLKDLSKIYLAWYGNRELEYSNGEYSIFPKSCELCHNSLMEFYSRFLAIDAAEYRKMLIEKLIYERKCDCYNKILKK